MPGPRARTRRTARTYAATASTASARAGAFGDHAVNHRAGVSGLTCVVIVRLRHRWQRQQHYSTAPSPAAL